MIDLETTGLVAGRHGILEIGAIHPASGDKWTIGVDPRPCEIDEESLALNGTTREELADASRLPAHAAVFWLVKWMFTRSGGLTAILAGRNIGFDLGFLLAAAEQMEADERDYVVSRISYRTLDTHAGVFLWALARQLPWGRGRHELYERLGIGEEAKPHRAMNGARLALAGLEALVREFQR